MLAEAGFIEDERNMTRCFYGRIYPLQHIIHETEVKFILDWCTIEHRHYRGNNEFPSRTVSVTFFGSVSQSYILS